MSSQSSQSPWGSQDSSPSSQPTSSAGFGSPGVRRTIIHQATRLVEGKYYCACQPPMPCVERESHTATNPNRIFFACAKDRDDPKNCKTFKWKDEILLTSSQASALQGSDGKPGLSKPSTSKTTMMPPPSTPQANRINTANLKSPLSQLGKLSINPQTPEEREAAKARRRAVIEASITKQAENPSSNRDTSSRAASIDDDDGYESAVSSIKPPPEKEQPKHPCHSTPIQVTNEGSPRKKFRPAGASSSPTKGIRSDNEDTSQWRALQDDTEYDFHQRHAALHLNSSTPSSSGHFVTPLSLGSPVASLKEMDNPPAKILQYLELLSTIDVQALVKHFGELQTKVLQLEMENQSLQQKNQALQDQIQQLKGNRKGPSFH